MGLQILEQELESAMGTIAVSLSAVLPPVLAPAEDQVWSLTQFYSVDFSLSWISVEKRVFSKCTESRFASAVCDSVLEPLRLSRHTWQYPCFYLVLLAMQEERGRSLKGALSAQKAFQGSETETRELLGGTEEVFPQWGVINLPSWQINDFFYIKQTGK